MAHPEALLLSALFNSSDVLGAESLGITPGHFHEFRAEYEWLVTYKVKYQAEPSFSSFKAQFPDFHLTDHTDITYGVEAVRKNHLHSQLAKRARALVSDLKTDDPEEILADLQSEVFKISSGYDTGVAMTNSVTDYSASLEYAMERDVAGAVIGIPWYHGSLRGAAFAQQAGDVTVFAARLSQGKSWVLVNEAAHAVLQGKRVLYFSLEMNKRAMEYRFQTIWAKALGYKQMTHTALDKGSGLDLLAYKEMLAEFSTVISGELIINDTSRGLVTPTTIAAAMNKYSPDLVVIDYLTLMGPSGGGNKNADNWLIVGSIMGELKRIATSFGTPILTASQINREGDTSNWRPPRAKNLSQSDSVGQDADAVVTMKRYGKGAMVYSLEKNRSGLDGLLWFSVFDPERGDFHEITKDEADEIKADAEFEDAA